MNEQKILETRQQLISRLTQLRMEQGMTQAELARRIGTQRSNVCRFESGQQNVTLDFYIRVANALGQELQFIWEQKELRLKLDSSERAEQRDGSVYSLRLFDEELLRFTLQNQGIEGLKAEILWVKEERRNLLPLDLTVSGEGMIKWLRRRVIPKNRAFVDEILKSLGLGIHDTKGIIDVCLGLSLNDSYWVVPDGFDGCFAEYNLYENRFSEALALVAYTGAGYSHQAFSTSPELTTHGMLRKAWRYIEADGVYLYKGGTEGGANTGNEPFSEFYACQIAEAMGLDAVRYDLENWKGILASKCRLFTSPEASFVSAGQLVKSGGIRGCLDYYDSLGQEFGEQLRSMLVFDAVIYNEDRHFGNFGLLRDSRTGKIFAPAPVFDNGLSLFNYGMMEDFSDLENYALTRSTPYGVSFEEICRQVMGAKQRTQLRRLIDFQFARHPNPQLNLPEWHLTAIEAQIQRRVRQLLAMPRR